VNNEYGLDSEDLLEQVRIFFHQILPSRPHYEARPEQLQMALAVARALQGQELLVVEAGTGTGKSLAYLIPSLLWAFQNHKPVVISTRTLNLQQQLMEQDIPLLRSLSPQPFRATPARGWSNYVCLRRLQATASSEQSEVALGQEAQELNESLSLGAPGVRQALQVSDGLWPLIQAESAACNRQLCPHFNDCYLFRERREMERSELIIANHSLVMADLSLRNEGAPGILPTPGCWVLDEAHHLEEVANDHLGRSLSLGQLQRLRQNMYDPKGKTQDSGWLPSLRGRLAATPVQSDVKSLLLNCLDQRLLMPLSGFYQTGEEFFHWLSEAIQALNTEGRMTLNPDFFHSPLGEHCRQSSSHWAASMEHIQNGAKELLQLLTDHELESQHGGAFELKGLIERLKGLRENLEFCLFPDSSDWVFWGQCNPQDVEIGATPLDVGKRLAQDFFTPARSAVITSATLALGKDLSFFQKRVGLDQLSHRLQGLCLNSPFDFKTRAYLGVATDLPDPNSIAFWQQSLESLTWLISRLKGRTFLLATSYASLRNAREQLQGPLAELGIRLLIQGQAPSGQLLADFRNDSRALLLGADSFWEGVDVPGDDLVCVIMARLPFRVPSDPLVKAHCIRIEESGGNSFGQYQMPQAILRFRQGFGRLIRSQRDRGMVLVLDSRLYHKSYGQQFMQSLPPCRRRAGKLKGLVLDAWSWFENPDRNEPPSTAT